MYNTLQNLSEENIQKLSNISSEINFIDTDKRMGTNGLAKPSIYTYSKWKTWNREQVREFKSIFAPSDIDTAIIGWYLKLPAETGFLDLMTTWVGKPCGSVIAYSMTDNQNIWLHNQEVMLQRGQGIKFKLSVPHEIKSSSQEQLWACIMQVE